jgi:NADH:ubiquinone oxidoreductase subunit 2 (subunit N)
MLLMGMAYIYAYTGSLSFYTGFASLLQMVKMGNPMVILGLGLIIFAVAFKLSLAPFHKWTPDVYQVHQRHWQPFWQLLRKLQPLVCLSAIYLQQAR